MCHPTTIKEMKMPSLEQRVTQLETDVKTLRNDLKMLRGDFDKFVAQYKPAPRLAFGSAPPASAAPGSVRLDFVPKHAIAVDARPLQALVNGTELTVGNVIGRDLYLWIASE
jgi:hypothetical protein